MLTEDSIHAFNSGCDARLAGLPLEACPYRSGVSRAEWARGWRDVNDHWGELAKWPVKPLPTMKAIAKCECGCGAVIMVEGARGRPRRFLQGHHVRIEMNNLKRA